MAEKIYQNSEEENFSNYNYEEFVRVIKKDEVINSSKSYKLNEIDSSKDNQKDNNLINSIQSSDITSLSISQTENLSQTSDNLYIPNDTKQNIVSGNKTEGKNEEKEMEYFFGYENYFRRIYPEKFEEYKTSRNYLPKKIKYVDKNVSIENNIGITINNETQNEFNNNQEENKIVFNSNNFQFVNNLYYYPMNGNIMYYLYNNFYINYSNIHPPSSSDVEDEKFEKDVHTTKKEEEIQNKIQDETKPKTEEKTGNENNTDKEGEYENIYIIKRKNVRNNYINNKKKYNKQERQERPKEKKYKNDYNHYNYNNKNNCYYNIDSIIDKKIIYNALNNKYQERYRNNDSYTKFNGNFDKRKKKYKYENNFYSKKYHKEIYY